MPMTSNYATCLGREIHYTEWGRGNREAVVLWHGLARTGRDFDVAARHLSAGYRVVCPDMLGRGLSQWSPDPEAEYCYDTYVRIAVDLLDRLGIERVRWVGTSMGGAIGMCAAGGPLKGRITHLVLNDIGPEIAAAAVERILAYAGNPQSYETMAAFEQFLRTVYLPFGYLSDGEWRHMAETSARRTDAGRITVHYDPRMVYQFSHHEGDLELWPAYDAIVARTMVLRGADSDLLTGAVAGEMTRRGPRARLEVIPGCGHAPALNVPEQLDIVTGFLAE